MQNVLRDTAETGAIPRRRGRVSTIFREYRNHFGLFWRVMLPVIIVSLIFNIALFLFFKLGVSEAQWSFSTSKGIGAQSSFSLDRSSGTSLPPPKPTEVDSGVGFNGSSLSIGFLWLAMCPLAFIIANRYSAINVSSGEAWQHTRRKAISILGICILMLLAAGGPFIIVTLIMAGFSDFLIQSAAASYSAPFFLFMLLAGVVAAYFLVKWSLSNQCVIIENLSAVAALRRSSELVRGAGGRFFGMYLLLTLVTMVFTTAVLSLTLLLFSVAAPEFAPLREVLLSGKFFGIFFGGYVEITLQRAPVWAIGVMIVVNTLIDTVLAPIWALLTTHLYLERAGTPEQEVLE